MKDETEEARRAMLADPMLPVRAAVESAMGAIWDTQELQRDFEVLGFAAPFVIVKRRSDGAQGSLSFTSLPRVYFDWVPDKPVVKGDFV